MIDRAAPFTLRAARAADAAALARVETAAFDPARYGGMMMNHRSFARHIASGRNAVLVAVGEDDLPVGYSLGFVKRGSLYVRFVSLAVHPDAEGRGAGGLLFRGIEDFARAGGFRGVRLEIHEDNQRLFERYTRLGYRVFARVADYYADGRAATRLVKDL